MPSASKLVDASLHTFNVHKNAVSSIQVVGDSLFSGSYDCSVAMIDLNKGAAAHTFHGSKSMVHCVRELAGKLHAGNDDGEILLLDWKSGQTAGTLIGHKRAVTCLCAEGNNLYSGSKDAVIRQWDLRTQKCLRKIRVHTGPVTCIQVLDGTLYSGSWDGVLYSFGQGEGRRQIDKKTTSPLLAMMPAVGLLYAAYRDGRTRVWAPGVEKVVTTFIAHDSGIPAIIIDEQARMYLGSDDRTISVWDLKSQSSYVDTEKRVCTYTGHSDGVLCLAKGETLLYSGSYDHSIKIWDLKAVDRVLVPGFADRSLPLHKLQDAGANMEAAAARADPDWWKIKPPFGGPYMQVRLGLVLDRNVILPTVLEVFPESVADFAGIQKGDQLTKLNDFETPTVKLLQECMTYVRPEEPVELVYEKRMPNGSTMSRTAKFNVQDPDKDADGSVTTIVTVNLLISGIYDVFDPEQPTLVQATAFLDFIGKNADFFRKLMLKYGEANDASYIRTRSFWLLLSKCKLVSHKFCLAQHNRLFYLNRIRQLYPHPRVQEIKNPHVHTGIIRVEDLIFGLVRLASHKYRKQPGNVQKFERLFTKHLFPFAMAETPDVLSQVGLGNIDQVIPHHQQRAVQKLFVKFSGLDAPEQAMTGEGFLRAVKSLNLPPSGSSDEYLHSVLTSCHSLYSRQMKPSDEVSPDAVLEREIVMDEMIYCLAVIGKKVLNKPESTSLSEITEEFFDQFVVTATR